MAVTFINMLKFRNLYLKNFFFFPIFWEFFFLYLLFRIERFFNN